MKIEKNNTIVADMLRAVYVTFAATLIAPALIRRMVYTSDRLEGVIIITVGCLAFLAVVSKSIFIKHRLKQRGPSLAAYAKQHLTTIPNVPAPLSPFLLMALHEVRGVRDAKLDNIITTEAWAYADFSYGIYRHTKYGDYRAATIYYAVMAVRLPRALPHVFFDSHHSRGKQFRHHFASSQLHRLEGDFDTFFSTYFPADYTIDSLSFVTPEVMWAMREARTYDIEIVGDRLYLYGSLEEPTKQVADMAAKITAINKALLNNILTYRDERLAFAEGRQRVSPLGMELARSKFWRYFTLGGLALYLLVWLVLQLLPYLSR
jgi:hypothetical protein